MAPPWPPLAGEPTAASRASGVTTLLSRAATTGRGGAPNPTVNLEDGGSADTVLRPDAPAEDGGQPDADASPGDVPDPGTNGDGSDAPTAPPDGSDMRTGEDGPDGSVPDSMYRDVVGTWHVNANGTRLTVILAESSSGTVPTLRGIVITETGSTEPLDQLAIDGEFLEFRRTGGDFYQWFRLRINNGVATGRFSHRATGARPPLQDFVFHATGWRASSFDGTPLAWEATVNNQVLARIRIDSSGNGGFIGRMKVYGSTDMRPAAEELESDLSTISFDGTRLEFTRNATGGVQVFTGTVNGRGISGTFTYGGQGSFPWIGTRAEILSYGPGVHMGGATIAATRLDSLRSRLVTLMMGGNSGVTEETFSTSDASLLSGSIPDDRDDDAAHHPRSYALKHWMGQGTVTNAFDSSPWKRSFGGYVATPIGTPPPGGFPVLIAVNGHGGSAYQTMSPSSLFWYGDAFARRGYVVVSVDISHRPPGDASTYGDIPNGDDPANGNGAHPSIKNSTAGTDFEEDGERVWDVMRAVDFAQSLPSVNPNRVLVGGLSLGGEVASLAAALDPRVAMAIVSGYSPDMGVMGLNGNHPCWKWAFADIREYVDVSDFEALVAPRPLVIETGTQDITFSPTHLFAGDKQVVRRARVAFDEQNAASHLVHYLHYDFHRFHVGDKRATDAVGLGVQAVAVGAPNPPETLGWQTDATTTTAFPTLFALISTLLP